MKIRNGFVSNSSSSSFTCDVCGGVESGWDMCLRDAEMTECASGHVFCDSHMKDSAKTLTLEKKQAKVLEWLEECGEDDEDILEGCRAGTEGWINDTYDNMLEEIDARYSWPIEACPCCQLTSVEDCALIKYLLHCYEQTREEVEQEIRDKFGTLTEVDNQLSPNE